MNLIQSVITARREKERGEGTREQSDQADDNRVECLGRFLSIDIFFFKMFHAYPASTNKSTNDILGENVLI